MLREGPGSLIENADVEMRLLAVGDTMLPLVLANPAADNGDVCSPRAHYVDYTREELSKRNPKIPMWLIQALFAAWSLPACRRWFDRVVYVNNWLLSTNPPVDLSEAQVCDMTRYLRRRYPDRAIVFRSITPELDATLPVLLRDQGYRLVPARTVYLFDPLNADLQRKRNARRDLALLRRSPLRFGLLKDGERGDFRTLEKLYRGLYIGKHSRLNMQYNSRFFAAALDDGYLEAAVLRDGASIVAMVLFRQESGLLLPHVTGYDLGYSRDAALYRHVFAYLLREARKRKVVLHLSAGAGAFKMHRGARPVIEYDAVMTEGLSFQQKSAWRLAEGQGLIWARKI